MSNLLGQAVSEVHFGFSATAGGPSPLLKLSDGVYESTANSLGQLTSSGTIPLEKMMTVGASYCFLFRTRDLAKCTMSVNAPGYQVMIDGIYQSSQTYEGITTETLFSVRVAVVSPRNTADGTTPIGESSQIAWGNVPVSVSGGATPGPWAWPYLTFNLGLALDGSMLPSLHVPLIKRDATSRTSSAHYCVEDTVPPDGAGVFLTSAPNAYGSFALQAPQVYLSYTVDPSAGTIEVKFAGPGSSTPFVTYLVEFPTWAWRDPGAFATATPGNVVKITKTVTGGNTYETAFSGSYTCFGISPQQSAPGTWTVEQWHVQNKTALSTLFGSRARAQRDRSNPDVPDGLTWYAAGRWTDDFAIRSGSANSPGNKASNTHHEYSIYVLNDGSYETSRTFLTTIVDGYGEQNFVTRSVANPYPAGGDNWGTDQQSVSGTILPTGQSIISMVASDTRIKTTYESWKDNSPSFDLVWANDRDSTVRTSFNVNGGAVTIYTPAGSVFPVLSDWAMFGWYSSIQKKLGNVTMSKSTMDYVDGTWGTAEKIVTVTRNEYKDGTNIGTRTIMKQFRPDTPDSALRGRLCSVASADGTKTSYAYERMAGNGLRVTSVRGLSSGDNLVTGLGTTSLDSIALVAKRSTKVVEVFENARVTSRAEYVYTGGTGTAPVFDENHPIVQESFAYTDDGRLSLRVAGNGTRYSATWVGTRKMSESDETGLTTTYEYDDADRVQSATRDGVTSQNVQAVVTHYEYDGAGRVTKVKVGPTGGEQLVTATEYYLDGRVKSKTMPGGLADDAHTTPAGITTVFGYSKGGLQVTETWPQGDKTTENFADGRLKSITGSMVVAEYHDYGDSTHPLEHTIHSGSSAGRSRVITSDCLGRTVSETTQSFPVDTNGTRKPIVSTSSYNSAGQLSSVSATYDPNGVKLAIGADRVSEYDVFGEVAASGIKLDLSTDKKDKLQQAGTDRFSKRDVAFNWDASTGWWKQVTETTFTKENSDTEKVIKITSTRLTGMPSGTLSQTDSLDAYNNVNDRPMTS